MNKANIKSHDTISAINDFGGVMNKAFLICLMAILVLASCAQTTQKMNEQVDIDQINKAVFAAEMAFAKTIVDRDFAAFATFIAEDAVFFSGDKPLRGKASILAAWQPYYADQMIPFTWQAEVVEAHASGNLALSNGPVYNSKGVVFARFNSVWQKQADGRWQVIFDKGTTVDDIKGKP